MTLLHIQELEVKFTTEAGSVHAVNGVSLDLDPGEILAIVGESGSGKSQMALSVMGLLAANGRASGSVRFEGREILGLPESSLVSLRGSQIGMIFQDPMTSLNPYMRVSAQMLEPLRQHRGLSGRKARNQCIEMLEAVGIPQSAERFEMYPHECSGGMRQRIMIALTLLCRPKLLIADEPTTALDVTVQAQIMALLKSVREDFGVSIMLITHDLGLVAGISDRTLVMYGGRVMESGPTEDIFATPTHPYTTALLQTIPHLDQDNVNLQPIPGEPPDMLDPPTGCPFASRCEVALDRCFVVNPPLLADGRRLSACHNSEGRKE